MIKSLKAMTPPRSGPLRLLLLDDQPADAELALLELERAGYQISAEVTQNLEDFSARLRTNFYDLVLSDYNLGEWTGMDAFSVLKHLERDTPFVLLSGSVGDEQAVNCVKQGVTDFVLKDNLVRLPLAVRRALEERALRAEQVLAQEALRESEERYRTVAETAGDAIITIDGRSAIRFANRATEKIFGYSPAELLGQELTILMPEAVRDAHRSGIRRYLETGEKRLSWRATQVTGRHRSGREVPLEIAFAEFREKNQRFFTGIIRDISERKQAEEALRQSHALLHGVAEGTSDAIFVKDLEGRYLLCNSACAATLGHPHDQILGKTDADLLDPETARNFMQGDRRALLAGTNQTSEEHQVGEGSGRFYLATKAPYRDGQGRVAGIIGISRDITERKREQEALRQSEEKFAKAFDSSPTAISISTLREGRYVDVNDSFLQMTGYQRSEIVGRTAAETGMWIHPETRASLVAALNRQGKVLDFDFLFRAKNGEERFGALSAEVIQVGGERCLLANVRDDTERRRAEQALFESQRQYESLVNSVDGIVWEADAATLCFTFVSQQAERLLGYPLEQWRSESDFWKSHIHPEDRQWAIEECLRAIAEQRDHNFEYRMLAADGRTVWLRDMVSQVDDNGTPKLRGLMVDVTQQREMEQQFRQAQKMEAVGQLAGGVAHDFNNLLMVIRGYCELMLDRLEAQSVVRTQAEGIMQAAQRASSVTRQLLAFSRKQVLSPKVLDLNDVVSDVSKMLLRLIGEDIELQVVKTSDLGRVKADPGQIEQVIVNLAVNARDAMPNGGKLTLETRDVELDNSYARHHISVQPGAYVLLAVTDNGMGMDAETRSRVFEPFFTTKEQGKGTGLGLATVYGIVKQSGGYIWVY
ncbi:MAG: PAS domain S-box protein, partial [Terriglobales bacterium]